MDYKEKYEQALAKAKDMLNYKEVRQEDMEYLFPELKESEDERIRKSLITLLQHFCKGYRVPGLDFPVSYKDMLAWLEKQGEQKPIEEANGEDYGIDGLYAAVDILESTLGKVQGYQTDDGILEHKCAIAAVKKLYEQNPAWSEEDENRLNSCISILNTSDGFETLNSKWLKDLKDRVQPKQEWSEEDKKIIREIINTLAMNEGNYQSNVVREKNNRSIDWLKSLRPQNRWKPSDEQMEVLLSEVKGWTKGCPKQIVLESLYNDLKKLKS